MRALNTVLSSVAGLPALFPALEDVLFPIMEKMISTDGQDIFEEVGKALVGRRSLTPLQDAWLHSATSH